MNHTYRLVWNEQTQRQVPAPESARACGKGGRSLPRLKPVALLLGMLMTQTALAQPPAANTLPTGGQVAAGQAGIAQNGSRMTVTQGSDKAIINWQSFNIGSQAGVTFQQPSTSAVALNRVVAGDASQIHGQLSANGQIWLINPNGIIFGSGSKVDVGGLVASTLATTDADFLAGKAVFKRNGATGAIVNQGEITAADGGLVALLAPSVANEGIIRARLGNVALAAGETVTLEAGADGHLQVAVTPATVRTLVENKQLIVADGGQVIMTAKAADALAGAIVANRGTVQAQTLAEKEGRILLLADMAHGEVIHSGKLDARAPVTGNGGFIETSAAKVTLPAGRQVTTAAGHGKTGTWLIDPNDYTIAASGGDITGSQLSSDLASTNVIIQSSSGATTGNGDINVNDAVSWSANKLTLSAERNININSDMNGSGTAQLALAYGQGAGASGNAADYYINNGAKVNLPAGQNFSTKLGNDGATVVYTVITDLGVAGDTSNTSLQGMKNNQGGRYAIGTDIDASETAEWNGRAGWIPLSFGGRLDGLGHKINNLTILRTSETYVGLIGLATFGTKIRNIGLTNANISGGNQVGGLIGGAVGPEIEIKNSFVTGQISGSDMIGGVIGGGLYGTKILNSYSSAHIIGLGDGLGSGSFSGVGGLAGYSDGDIVNCYATGSVLTSGRNMASGGLVGLYTNWWGSLLIGIKNSYAVGNVSNNSLFVAGFIGLTLDSRFDGYWGTETSGQSIGTSLGSVSTSRSIMGITNTQMQQQASFTGWDFTNTWRIYEGQSYPVLRTFQKDLTVTANNASKTYDGTAYSGGNGITQSTASALTGAVTYGGSSQGAINADSYIIAPSVAMTQQDYQNWHVSYVDGTLTINPAVLTTTITDSLTGTVQKTYDGTTAATLNAGNFLLTGWVGSDNATVTKTTGTYDNANAGNGKTVTVTLAGNDYRATGSTNLANYTLPTSISGKVGVIDKAALTVTANDAGKTYDGTAWSGGNGVAYAGFVAGQNASALSGTLAYGGNSQGALNAGSYSISPSGLSSGNYALTFHDGTLTINRALLSGSLTGTVQKTYDGTTAATLNAGNFLLTGWVGSDNATVTKTTGSYDNANAGSGKMLTVNLASSDYSATSSTNLANYTLPKSISGKIGVIDKAALTVTANDAGKTYDGTAWSGGNGVAYAGFVAGQNASALSGTLAYGGSSQGALNAGSYSISPSGLSSGNYAIAFHDGTLTINPALLGGGVAGSLTGTVQKTYDGTTAAALNAGNFLLTGWVGSDNATVTKTTGSYDNANAGSGKIVTVNLANSDYNATGSTNLTNYVLPANISGKVGVIDKAALTVTANDAGKTFDGTAWSGGNGVAYAGFVAGQNASALSGTLAYGGSSQGALNAGSYSISPSGLSSGNYAIAFHDGTLTINPALLSGSITGSLTGTVQKTYDGTTAAALNAGNFLLSGWVGSDNATVTKTAGTYDNANAGSGKTVTVNLANSDYNAAGSTNLTNYVLPTSISGKVGVIDKAALTVTANDAGKTFDGTAWSGGNGVAYAGFVAGQNASALSGTLAYGGSSQGALNAGSYSISPSGLSSGNYAIAFHDGILIIDPAPTPVAPIEHGEIIAAAPARVAPPSTGDIWRLTQPWLTPPSAQHPTNALSAEQASEGNLPFLTLAPEFIRVGD